MEIVSNEPIDPSKVYELIAKECSGSIVLHFAAVRPKTQGKTTSSIEYCADGDVAGELREISRDIRDKWKVEDVLIARRIGKLNVGDIISLVAVSAAHRQDGFEGCRCGVERLKKMSTIVKKETFA
ncbi:MAG: molybdenum cofactor biosynthesis protein MoaE [Planctomycetota bacterium]